MDSNQLGKQIKFIVFKDTKWNNAKHNNTIDFFLRYYLLIFLPIKIRIAINNICCQQSNTN